MQWQKGHKYLTLVYQIDDGRKRLLWIGKDRTTTTFLRFFRMLGKERSGKLKFVCSDMWKPYLTGDRRRKLAVRFIVLDRFHIMQKMNKAIDEVRAGEARQMKVDGYEPRKRGFKVLHGVARLGGKFLDQWCTRTMRSQLEPMKKVARTLRNHRELILNWFRAKGALSSGIVEGFNNKVKLTTRKSYGFRTYEAVETALYHNLGALPQPGFTHKFW